MDEFDNKWSNDSDEDSEINDEYIQNDVPPQNISDEFVNNVMNIKNNLYESIVLGPEEGTTEAQSKTLLQEYLNKINQLYILSLNAQKGNIVNTDEKLNNFPENTREQIKQLLHWIDDYFKKNNIPDTIPYSDFIRNSYHEYPFVQNNYFE